MEPMEQGAALNGQETAATQGHAEAKPDAQTGAVPISGGELAKSTVMREAVPKSAPQGRAAASAKKSKKITFGSVLFVIGIIALIGTLLITVLMLLNSGGEKGYLLISAAFSLLISGVFSGLMLMGAGKGLMLLQELVNVARSKVQ